ncbi:MAG: FAD-dependent oxidoreductase [Chloroflexi bacterium]|nr:FAD-dependent oxidoreductase [Chloroflexota bacterium]
MVGSDDAGLLIAADLLGAGAEVVAVVDESPVVLGREVNAEPLRDAGVEFLTSTRVVAASGGDRVDTVTVGRVDSSLHADVRSFDVDTVCLAGPRSPRTRLSNVLGCPHSDKPVLGGLVPVHDRWMETPLPGLFVCGDVAGVENGAVALESGRLVGLRLAHLLGYRHPRAGEQERLARGRLAYLRRGSRGGMRREAKAAIAVEHRRLVSSAPTRPSMHHR